MVKSALILLILLAGATYVTTMAPIEKMATSTADQARPRPKSQLAANNKQASEDRRTSDKAQVDCVCVDPAIHERGHCYKSYAIVFTSKFCASCKRMYPVINELRGQDYIVYVRDLSNPKYTPLGRRLKINATPTIVIYDQGEEIQRLEGVVSEEKIKSKMRPRKKRYKLSWNPYEIFKAA